MTDDDLSQTTHVDRDGDAWRITSTGTHLWSNHQHYWVEARAVLDVTHLAHGTDWLIAVVPGSARPVERNPR